MTVHPLGAIIVIMFIVGNFGKLSDYLDISENKPKKYAFWVIFVCNNNYPIIRTFDSCIVIQLTVSDISSIT